MIFSARQDIFINKMPPKKATSTAPTLKPRFYSPANSPCAKRLLQFEMGVDEAGRGPLFGRVYAGAVILPFPTSDDDPQRFKFELLKDSKKFTSHKKLGEVAKYIMENAIAWGIGYQDADQIDRDNILRATQTAMHAAISEAIERFDANPTVTNEEKDILPHLLVDGNHFRAMLNPRTHTSFLEHTTVVQGDGTYCSIAAASILAKWFRDAYIDEMCDEHPELNEKYGLRKNKGYGTKAHLDAILEHGVSQWHRRSFGRCKEAELNEISQSL